MIAKAAGTLIGCLIATSASAQNNPCAAVQNEQDRLRCYDAANSTKPAKPKSDDILSKARAAVRLNLKDPDSARFEGLIARPGGAVCGFVNSKTSMGGYGGRLLFVYVSSENRAYVLEVGSPDGNQALALSEKHCKNVPGW